MAENNGGARQGYFLMVPLIVIMVLVYNLLAFVGPSFIDKEGDGYRAYAASVDSSVAADASDKALQVGYLLDKHIDINMMSGDIWRFTLGSGILAIGLGLLLLEVVRATNTATTSIINNALSMLVFIGSLLEFLLLQGFATSTFFILMAMSLFDVIGGFSITAIAARRDFGGGGLAVGGGS